LHRSWPMKYFLFVLLFLLAIVSVNASAATYRDVVEEVIYQVDSSSQEDTDLDSDLVLRKSLELINQSPRFNQKGFWGEVGRAVLGALVGEVVREVRENLRNNPERPAPVERPNNPPSEGTDHTGGPNPAPCPAPGN